MCTLSDYNKISTSYRKNDRNNEPYILLGAKTIYGNGNIYHFGYDLESTPIGTESYILPTPRYRGYHVFDERTLDLGASISLSGNNNRTRSPEDPSSESSYHTDTYEKVESLDRNSLFFAYDTFIELEGFNREIIGPQLEVADFILRLQEFQGRKLSVNSIN